MRKSNLYSFIKTKFIQEESVLIQRSYLVCISVCVYALKLTIRKIILFVNHSSPFPCHWLKLHSFSCISTCSRVWWIKRAMSKVVLIAQALLEAFLHSETQKTLNGVRGLYWEVLSFRTFRWFTHCAETLSCTDKFINLSSFQLWEHHRALVSFSCLEQIAQETRQTSEFTDLSLVHLCRTVLANYFYKILYT